MIFPNYRYKEYNNSNHIHTIEEWCDMVNKSHQYCSKFNEWKWFLFWFYIQIGRVDRIDVPSHHPYWASRSEQSTRKYLNEIVSRYEKCKKNPELIKVYFNLDASIESIEMEISNIKSGFNTDRKGFFESLFDQPIK